MEPDDEQLRLFPPLPDEVRMTSQELAHLLAREGIDSSALTRFCLSPDGEQFIVRLPQATAGAAWKRARACVQATGYWPVLTLGYAAMDWTEAETADEAALLAGRSAQAVVMQALRLDVQAWLAARQALYGTDEDDPGYAEALAGTWPAGVQPSSDFWILDASDQPAWLDLRFVPTRLSWQVPAFFTYGGSSGLDPHEHVAVLKEWYERYGAEVVTIAGDTIELVVARPPRDRAEAWALAYQQFAYCPDVVVQGTQTISLLAAQLLGGTTWYFWWD